MCGIAGVLNLEGGHVPIDWLRAMCQSMVHRGPNDEGIYHADSIGLGMRRLSIIDLETGHQPVRNEDGTIWLVLNGEIYNFRELRQELKRGGHAFYTATDTETIVHLYEDHGTRCVEKLRGMFAFALWDSRRKMLLLARDRMGIKPLYYAQSGGILSFGSELKTLLPLPHVERSLNWSAVNHLFTYLTTSATESVIEGVQKLEPGHILTASAADGLRTESYWSVRFEPDYGLTEEYCRERTRELIEESVRLHLESDVPVGAFLSGGLDSSAVVAAMTKYVPGRVKTFSIGFKEERYNESGFARMVADRLGTEHYEFIVQPDVWEFIDQLTWYLDEPFGDCSAIPTYMVSKAAAEHVKVVLSGDGGDELFAGYDKYVVEQRERRVDRVPALLRKGPGMIAGLMPEGTKGRNFLRHFALSGWDRYMDASVLFKNDEKKKLFSGDVLRTLGDTEIGRFEKELTKCNGHWLSVIQHRDMERYLPLDILTKVDRMSMAHSLEARVPLLDHKLVEFVATVPPELKLRNGTTKYIFKQAMKDVLPDAVVNRRKQGFAVPVGHWFNGALDGVVHDLLLSSRCRQRGIFNARYIERLLELHKRRQDLDLKLWTLVSFELWCRMFLDRELEGVSPPAPMTVSQPRP